MGEYTYRGVIGVGGGHGGSSLRGELVELTGGDALIDAGADLLGDEDWVAVLLAEAVAELLKPRRDLVELHRFLPAVALYHVHRSLAPPPKPDGCGFGIGMETTTRVFKRLSEGGDRGVIRLPGPFSCLFLFFFNEEFVSSLLIEKRNRFKAGKENSKSFFARVFGCNFCS